jgi:hypothetical protein
MGVQPDVVCSRDASETIVEANEAATPVATAHADSGRPGGLNRVSLRHRAS